MSISLINELPTEILCEIFLRCVDQASARVLMLMQPNSKIAPMLLCHVCATWRATVRAIPAFWSHLRFELPLNWHSNGRPYTWDRELLTCRLAWLRWWRRHLGELAPYLQVELRRQEGEKYRRGRLSESASEFLLEFMSSAQYISVGKLYRYLIQRRTDAGYVVRVHPSAHTIVSTWDPRSEFGPLDNCNAYQKSMLSQIQSTLRCITIENVNLSAPEFANPLSNWSTLTHLSMDMVLLHLDTWFPFIRSLSALESGSFRLGFEDRDIETYPRPSIGTLSRLTAFHISAYQHSKDHGEYPLKAAFDNLQLPALRTLSLNSRARTWRDSTALAELHAALLSAPGITTLALGSYFLGAQEHDDADTETSATEPIRNGITPLVAKWTPRLEHLTFAMESPLDRRSVFQFVDVIFGSSRRLDFGLEHPASTVREVTFMSSSETSEPIDMVAERTQRSLLISEVRTFVTDGMIVGFEEEGPVEVRRAVWGW
ncbi:hypothetical protein BJ912DRAFT_71450 [Pholiota molesta]|nr:hypothetical protein BJ912DRAFT_71450 [Pholiota molesta]